MLAEFRFQQLHPRCVPEYLEGFRRFAEAAPELRGCWRTEVGAIDSIVQLWLFKDEARRKAALAAEAADPVVAGLQKKLVMTDDSMLLTPTPFSPAEPGGTFGQIYELRIYTYEPGRIPTVIERWQEKIEQRVKLSPIAFCGYSSSGRMNQWAHLWGYPDAKLRQEVRAESLRTKIWPPDAREGMILQRNMLLVPAPYSLLR